MSIKIKRNDEMLACYHITNPWTEHEGQLPIPFSDSHQAAALESSFGYLPEQNADNEYNILRNKDENGRKRSETDLRYGKTKTVGSEYFYI
jgi:hypothetical protein